MTVAARPFWCWGGPQRPLQAHPGSWHAYDQHVALSRRATASAATRMVTVMQSKLMRSDWSAATYVCDHPVERSVVLLALQQAPEEARQDPSWRHLSSDTSAAVRAEWRQMLHPTLVARCGAASAPKGAETAPDLAKALVARPRGGSGCRGFSAILLERLVGLTSGLKFCTAPDMLRAEFQRPAEERPASGALVEKRVTNTFVTFLCESVPGSRNTTRR